MSIANTVTLILGHLIMSQFLERTSFQTDLFKAFHEA